MHKYRYYCPPTFTKFRCKTNMNFKNYNQMIRLTKQCVFHVISLSLCIVLTERNLQPKAKMRKTFITNFHMHHAYITMKKFQLLTSID